MAASSGIGRDDAFYEQFQALLNESIPDCSPAEVQGMLTGLVCAGETDDQFKSWGALLVENDPKNPVNPVKMTLIKVESIPKIGVYQLPGIFSWNILDKSSFTLPPHFNF